VKKPDVEIGPISRRPARGSDDHPSKPKPGLPGTPTDAAKTPQQRSFDFAQDFPSACTSGQALRVPARLDASLTPAKRLNTDPSTTLGTSARGSDDHPSKPKPGLPGTPTDAAKTPQLYKKRGSFRPSVHGVDFRAVRCGRIADGLSQSVTLVPWKCFTTRRRGGAKEDGSDQSAMFSRTPPRHTSLSADWLGSGVLMLVDSSPAAMNRGGQPGVFSFQRTAYARLLFLGAGEKQPAFPLIVYILYR